MQNEQCKTCAWYFGDLRCAAFDRIPARFLGGGEEHNEVVDGQVGEFVYKPEGEPLFQPDNAK